MTQSNKQDLTDDMVGWMYPTVHHVQIRRLHWAFFTPSSSSSLLKMTLHYFNKRQKTAAGNTLRGDDQDLVSSAPLCILHLFAGMTRHYIDLYSGIRLLFWYSLSEIWLKIHSTIRGFPNFKFLVISAISCSCFTYIIWRLLYSGRREVTDDFNAPFTAVWCQDSRDTSEICLNFTMLRPSTVKKVLNIILLL